jgi:hypothetical protein
MPRTTGCAVAVSSNADQGVWPSTAPYELNHKWFTALPIDRSSSAG